MKRCNNCQQFGHFAKDCSSLDDPKCAKCGESHRTDSCSSENRSCVNRVRNNLSDTNHQAFYHKKEKHMDNNYIIIGGET